MTRTEMALTVACILLVAAATHAQKAMESSPAQGGHRTPEGWRFTWPAGNPLKGREVFVKLECYSCHEVSGESFPAPSDRQRVGPELAAMGPVHEVEYFVEALVNPSVTIEKGKGYEAADGSSKMPSFNDSMAVQELVDLVAYLRALKPPAGAGAPAPSGGHGQH